jgi:hypothetical protein
MEHRKRNPGSSRGKKKSDRRLNIHSGFAAVVKTQHDNALLLALALQGGEKFADALPHFDDKQNRQKARGMTVERQGGGSGRRRADRQK